MVAWRGTGETSTAGPPTLRVMARPRSKNRSKLPYNALLYDAIERDEDVKIVEYDWRKIILHRWSVVHLHWPESLLDTASLVRAKLSAAWQLGLLDLAKRRGARLLWTAHDLEPHDYVFFNTERRFWCAVMRRLDGVIALTYGGLERVHAAYPATRNLPGFVIPHGHFRGFYPRPPPLVARRELGLPEAAFVVGFFGQIRPYKNIPRLIETFRAVAPKGAVLLVAGRTNRRTNEVERVLAAADGDVRVRLHLGFVPNERVGTYLAAMDLVALPFAMTLNSGSTILALSCDRPLLVPRVGALPELEAEVGPDWVRSYSGELDAGTLAAAIQWAIATPRGLSAPLDHLDWAAIGRRTVAAYRELCRVPSP